MYIPAGKLGGKIRRAVHNTVTEIRSGNSQSDPGDLLPREIVGREKCVDGPDPAVDHAAASRSGFCRPLQHFLRHRFAIAADRRNLRRGRPAVCADVDFFAHWFEAIEGTRRGWSPAEDASMV